jgi:predicted Zn-dependent peptidase
MDDAKNFFETFYHPSNAVLCIAGDIDLASAQNLVERYFGTISDAGAEITRTRFLPEMMRRGTHATVTDNVPLTAVFVSLHMPGFSNNELLDAEIAASIIGSGRSSVLYKKLVSDLRIASGVGCVLDRRAHDSLLTMYAYAADESVTADQLVSGITDVLSQTVVTTTMLESAVNKMKTSHAAELQKANGVADVVAWTTLFWNDPLYVNTALERYGTVTTEDIQNIVSRCASTSESVRLDITPQ